MVRNRMLTNEGRVRKQTKTLYSRDLYRTVCNAKHDERLGVLAMYLHLITALRKPRRQGEDAAG